jgi:hypothetical protein
MFCLMFRRLCVFFSYWKIINLLAMLVLDVSVSTVAIIEYILDIARQLVYG